MGGASCRDHGGRIEEGGDFISDLISTEGEGLKFEARVCVCVGMGLQSGRGGGWTGERDLTAEEGGRMPSFLSSVVEGDRKSMGGRLDGLPSAVTLGGAPGELE